MDIQTENRARRRWYHHFSWDSMYAQAGMAGLVAAIFMATAIFILKLAFEEIPLWLLYMPYLLLIAKIWFFLVAEKKSLTASESFFDKGIVGGLTVSLAAAISFFVIEAVIFTIVPAVTISNKFGMQATDFGSALTVFGSQSLEIIVYGFISTFICLQYLKRPAEESQTTA